MKGIVKRVRKGKDGFILSILSEEGEITTKSNKYIADKSFIEFETRGEYILWFKEIEGIKRFIEKVGERIILNDIKPFADLNDFEDIDKLFKDIREFAKKIKEIDLIGRDSIVRFNNDADGISSALQLRNVLRSFYIQHNAPIYFKRDAFVDLNNLINRFIPSLILLDFGGNEESLESLEILHSSGIEVLIIDHHPFEKEVEKYAKILNPHKYGDYSFITTGYLCFEIARLIKQGDEELMKISLAGDKSNLIEIGEEDKENALIIDYVANYMNYGGKIDLYKEVLSNKELRETIRIQAKEKLEEAKEKIKRMYKKENIGEFSIYEINLDNIDRTEFPSRSKITTQLFEMFKEEKAVILGITNKAIIFRVSETAYEGGISAKEIIEKIKEKYGNLIESGGGHGKAASIKVKEESNLNFIKNEVKNEIKKIVEGE